MKRVGMNPARDRVSDYRPARVTAAVLTYIPMLGGYFSDRLRILQLSLESMAAHTSLPFDLMVFDNGSCREVQDFLTQKKEEGLIRYLLLSSENIGKIGALKIMFHAAPGEIIAYSDDDIYFYPDWLESQLQVLDHFPEVGMVSGVPIRIRFNDAQESNQRIAESHPEISIHSGRWIPDEWEEDFCASTGRKPVEYKNLTEGIQDIVFEYRGHRAYSTANHFQFLSPKAVIQAALPENWSGRLMRRMLEMDEAVDQLGYLRLSTTERYVRHMGNVLTHQEATFSIEAMESSHANPEVDMPFLQRAVRRVVRIRFIRRTLESIYNSIFWLLNEGRIRWSGEGKTKRW